MTGSNASFPVLATTLLLALCACATPSDEASSSAASSADGRPPEEALAKAAPLPWTAAFEARQVLIAAEVRVEGPKGLLNHFATASDPDELVRSEKTTPEGFLLEIAVKPEVLSGEIKAQLDGLAIVATRRLVVLERPGTVDVAIAAQGDAYWHNTKTDEEKRGETLRLSGAIAR